MAGSAVWASGWRSDGRSETRTCSSSWKKIGLGEADRQERRRDSSPRRGAGLEGPVAATKKKRLPHVGNQATPLDGLGETDLGTWELVGDGGGGGGAGVESGAPSTTGPDNDSAATTPKKVRRIEPIASPPVHRRGAIFPANSCHIARESGSQQDARRRQRVRRDPLLAAQRWCLSRPTFHREAKADDHQTCVAGPR